MTDSTFYDALAEDLNRDEGNKQFAYQDSRGFWTIGIGRCIDARVPGAGLRSEERLYLLRNDIAAIGAELRPFVWYAGLSDGRRRAIAEMAFNLGVPKLLGFRNMIRALALSDWETAAKEALASKWADETDGKLDGKDGARAERIAELIRNG